MQWFVRLFPIWTLGASIIAFFCPPAFTWFSGNLITVGLGGIMLGMGLTLTVDDFRRVLTAPLEILGGVALQFTVMPLAGWSLSQALGLPPEFAAGLILVACCPGGTASNIIAYLSRADVALSVSMTSVSTILAVMMTPTLATFFIGNTVAVDPLGLFTKTVTVVLLPVAAGLLMRRFTPKLANGLLPIAPPLAVLLVTLIVASIIGSGRDIIREAAPSLFVAVITLHALGFGLGYGLSSLITPRRTVRRTVSIEVGMQNSGLGAELARTNFASTIAASVAVPSALSALTHCIYGSVIAWWWQRSGDEALAESQESAHAEA
jgi:BASS family bile acid:Na+ symporter